MTPPVLTGARLQRDYRHSKQLRIKSRYNKLQSISAQGDRRKSEAKSVTHELR